MEKGFYIVCKETNEIVASGIHNIKGACVCATTLKFQHEKENLTYVVKYKM